MRCVWVCGQGQQALGPCFTLATVGISLPRDTDGSHMPIPVQDAVHDGTTMEILVNAADGLTEPACELRLTQERSHITHTSRFGCDLLVLAMRTQD